MITACLCIAQHAMAQVVIPTDTAKEVVITENRLEIPFRKLSQNIDVISTADIKTRPARSVPEILSYTGGMDVRQRGPGGVQADLSIRGGGFEQSLVLLNGIKLSDPQTGHHLMAVPVPTSAIERIDILKGPGARIFGQNAFSGAVNIVTMLPEKKSLETMPAAMCWRLTTATSRVMWSRKTGAIFATVQKSARCCCTSARKWASAPNKPLPWATARMIC